MIIIIAFLVGFDNLLAWKDIFKKQVPLVAEKGLWVKKRNEFFMIYTQSGP